ncbi:hypothetical protein BSF43_49060 [Pseudomonas ogarae]|nr:hypothetical protein BSF43_49060 [Pseudomonas ogarae]
MPQRQSRICRKGRPSSITLRCKVPLAADSMGLECLWRILLFAGV